MADVVPFALKLLYRRQGPPLLEDPKGCREHLLKICPEEAAEIEAFVAAMELGIPQRLASAPSTTGIAGGLAESLVTERSVDPELAALVVEGWAGVLQKASAEARDSPTVPFNGPRQGPGPAPPTARAPSPTIADLPGSAEGWLDRGDALEPDAVAVLGGESVSKVECYRRALGLDPRLAEAWVNLGTSLSPETRVTVSGMEVDERSCYVRALEIAPDLVAGWMNLGEGLAVGERVRVGREEVTSVDCYQRALEVDEGIASAWLLLGLELGEADRAQVRGATLARRDCLLRALELDRSSAEAWAALGEVLGPEGRMHIDEEEVDRLSCYRRAVTIDPTDAVLWTDLGASIEGDQRVEAAGGKVDRRHCFLRALAIDPKLATAWSNLGESLGPDEVAEVGGISYAGLKCVLRALALDPQLPPAWIAAAAILRPEELLRFGERRFSRTDCLVQALELDGSSEEAWAELAAVLRSSETVVVGGQRLTREECRQRAGAWQPQGRAANAPPPAPSGPALAPSTREAVAQAEGGAQVSVAVRLAEEEPSGPFGDLEVAESLRMLYDQEGPGLLEDPARFRLLLLGLCPGDRRTVDALTIALEEGVPQRLRATSLLEGRFSGSDHEEALASLLGSRRGLGAEEAHWVLWSWGYAQDLPGFEVPGDPH